MKSYDLIIHKEIVRRLVAEGITVREETLGYYKPIVVVSDTTEVPDNTKTYDRNNISYTVKMWGSKNGNSIELKELKAKVVEALTEGEYEIPGYKIDLVTIDNVATFKEYENTNSDNTSHYYQSILNISYKIKEER